MKLSPKVRVIVKVEVFVDRAEYELNYGSNSAQEIREDAQERVRGHLVESYSRSGLPLTADRVTVVR